MPSAASLQHSIMNYSTSQHLHPLIVVKDLEFKGRVSEGEVGVYPSFFTFSKEVV